MSNGNWSTETQAHTQICILESQLSVRDREKTSLKEKNDMLELKLMELRDEIDRLRLLVNKMTIGDQETLLDRFK